jgi:hypothetical protein
MNPAGRVHIMNGFAGIANIALAIIACRDLLDHPGAAVTAIDHLISEGVNKLF